MLQNKLVQPDTGRQYEDRNILQEIKTEGWKEMRDWRLCMSTCINSNDGRKRRTLESSIWTI
jgi:hypothetical protein